MSRSVSLIVLLLTIHAVRVSADEAADMAVFPAMLHLVLDQGERATESVSLTIAPACFRAIHVDVVASDPGALVTNLTGGLINGCNGATSSFEVELTGTGAPQRYDLLFIDAEYGGSVASLPVTISPALGGVLAVPTLGTSGLALLAVLMAAGSVLLLHRRGA